MGAVKCDSSGRINLGKAVIKEYGREFVILPAPGKIVLIPVQKDLTSRQLQKRVREIKRKYGISNPK